MRQLFTIPLILLLFALCPGQTLTLVSKPKAITCVNPKTISDVTRDYYRIISGSSGGRDWDRLRTLTLETTRFDAVGINEKGENQFHPQSIEDYINHLGEYLKKHGFYQSELKRTTKCYARIAHVFSTYESRNAMKGKVIDRGIMSFQLIHTEGRWKIAHVMWNSETREYRIPAQYLK